MFLYTALPIHLRVYTIYGAPHLTLTHLLIFTHTHTHTHRLHREALKQSATDPKTGIIDVGILTTGVSSSERTQRQMLAKELLKLLQSKAKGGAQLKMAAVLEMIQAQSQVVSLISKISRTHTHTLSLCSR